MSSCSDNWTRPVFVYINWPARKVIYIIYGGCIGHRLKLGNFLQGTKH